MTPRRTAVVAAAIGAAGAVGLLMLILAGATIHIPPSAVEQATARPRGPVDEVLCAATSTRYHRELESANHCSSDDACRGEARGAFFTDLDECSRFLPATAPVKDLDALAEQWLAAGCAHDYLTCTGEPRARCVAGRCVERAPPGIPEEWVRITVRRTFTFFVPPELHGTMGHGDDSYGGRWESPKMTLVFDLGEWANHLDLDDGPDVPDHQRTRMTVIGGAEAKLVTARTREALRDGGVQVHHVSGVYFPKVPLRMPSLIAGTSLNLFAWCDAVEGCADAETIFRSIEFY